ncbi:formate dehydrogenase subunit gamma [Pseudomonas sp. Bc-h]|jgi:formate dehydrogenase subunit gamma|uniref:formate dehydrogenase subunit gamma n=1 Tax=unclassified Pseudomonas TaxID=196821 RepID=UPI0009DA05E4|nr:MULTISPECIES: formate dehydrogenase subunit gamma [unclassified Pseudomonas]MDE1198530.1 formate dehydrogenase subunit gamma [Pseudomonas sp.]OQR36870.1 formate dehydrogenase subunit gamma [Pseudomonas sp. Bc-h]
MSDNREPGKTILRYNANERTNHWLVAILFFMAGLSGLALFHPAMFWLTNLFGGGPWTRILHPFMGVAMFVFFFGLVIRFWRANLFIPNDRLWLKRIDRVMVNSEEGVPPIGKYNPGQKLLFWTLLLCMLGLLLSGLVIWRAYFSEYFGITVIRLGALVHALAGFVLITSIIVHIYAGIWIKGSVGAMLHGWVSRRWAKKHHELWYRQIVDKDGRPDQVPPRITKKG